MGSRFPVGILDTCAYIDLADIEPDSLPEEPRLTTVTMAELHQGVAMAKNAVDRARRTERLRDAIEVFDPMPFDADAAARFGTLVALVLAAKRDPRPRKLDLMIAAIASSAGMPLYTRNIRDFTGLESLVTLVAI